MRPPVPSRMWETFLKIGDHAPGRDPSEEVVYADPDAQRRETLEYLHVLHDRVLPTVRGLERAGAIDWYAFLVHDRAGGVPVPEDDRGVYVHLRLSLAEGMNDITTDADVGKGWQMTKRVHPAPDEASIADWHLLGEQSAMVLGIVERTAPRGDDALLGALGAFLHYFANMAQMRVR